LFIDGVNLLAETSVIWKMLDKQFSTQSGRDMILRMMNEACSMLISILAHRRTHGWIGMCLFISVSVCCHRF